MKAGEQRVAKLLCRPALLSGRRLRGKVLASSNLVEVAAARSCWTREGKVRDSRSQQNASRASTASPEGRQTFLRCAAESSRDAAAEGGLRSKTSGVLGRTKGRGACARCGCRKRTEPAGRGEKRERLREGESE